MVAKAVLSWLLLVYFVFLSRTQAMTVAEAALHVLAFILFVLVPGDGFQGCVVLVDADFNCPSVLVRGDSLEGLLSSLSATAITSGISFPTAAA